MGGESAKEKKGKNACICDASVDDDDDDDDMLLWSALLTCPASWAPILQVQVLAPFPMDFLHLDFLSFFWAEVQRAV